MRSRSPEILSIMFQSGHLYPKPFLPRSLAKSRDRGRLALVSQTRPLPSMTCFGIIIAGEVDDFSFLHDGFLEAGGNKVMHLCMVDLALVHSVLYPGQVDLSSEEDVRYYLVNDR